MDRFFDGVRWNPEAVIAAQLDRANQRATSLGLQLTRSNVLANPLSGSFVSSFERTARCVLPDEYRSFLLQVGDGGDGPGLQLRQLGAPFERSNAWRRGEIYVGPLEPNARLDQPFPYAEAEPADPSFIEALNADVFPEQFVVDPQDAVALGYPGALYLFDWGASVWDLLVVNGVSYGEIWADRVADGHGCSPVSVNSARSGFAEYYCAWLAGAGD